jgi:hypothetical protein
MMGLGLGMNIEQIIICEVCGRGIHEHTPRECPMASMDALSRARKTWNCPGCHASRSLEVNDGDFFECRKCRAVYASGLGAGDPPDEKREVLIDLDANEAITVFRLPGLGAGKYPIDKTFKTLRAMAREMKRARAAEKAKAQKKGAK